MKKNLEFQAAEQEKEIMVGWFFTVSIASCSENMTCDRGHQL